VFHPFSPVKNNENSNSSRSFVIHNTHSHNTIDNNVVIDSIDITDAVNCADTSTTTTRRKRCRTTYAQDEDGALNGTTNDSYMGRAVKHCIIL